MPSAIPAIGRRAGGFLLGKQEPQAVELLIQDGFTDFRLLIDWRRYSAARCEGSGAAAKKLPK
jgi:hypothetical protein